MTKMRIVSCINPEASQYRVACSKCGMVSVRSMHGQIKCMLCNTEESAHDMLVEYMQREQFLDEITRPAVRSGQTLIDKNTDGGVPIKE